jgi:hypothetical protein
VTLSADLGDGHYQLLLETSEKYFRDPKGYHFTVSDSAVVNPQGRPITFDLIPPQSRDYQPYRGPTTVPDGSSEAPPPKPAAPGEVIYRSESFIGLSAPPKQPLPDLPVMTQAPQTPRLTGRHYVIFAVLLAVGLALLGFGMIRFSWFRKRRAWLPFRRKHTTE